MIVAAAQRTRASIPSHRSRGRYENHLPIRCHRRTTLIILATRYSNYNCNLNNILFLMLLSIGYSESVRRNARLIRFVWLSRDFDLTFMWSDEIGMSTFMGYNSKKMDNILYFALSYVLYKVNGHLDIN